MPPAWPSRSPPTRGLSRSTHTRSSPRFPPQPQPRRTFMLLLDDHWTWDFWTIKDGVDYHLFFLKAPKSLGDPDARHQNARIGHAVSVDLTDWTVLPDALAPGPGGAWDDMSTWTGSVIKADGRWHMYYTGVNHAERGLVQRIGRASSDDLVTLVKDDAFQLEADPRWYEQLDLDT